MILESNQSGMSVSICIMSWYKQDSRGELTGTVYFTVCTLLIVLAIVLTF